MELRHEGKAEPCRQGKVWERLTPLAFSSFVVGPTARLSTDDTRQQGLEAEPVVTTD